MSSTKRRFPRWLLTVLVMSTLATKSAEVRVYLGTYTGAGSRGIYRTALDLETGGLQAPVLAAEATNPSFLALHPNGRFLYAVGEIAGTESAPGGTVSAFSVDAATGDLALLNSASSGGAGPCHLTVDATGKWVLVANYGGGSVAVLPIRDDGGLGEAVCVIQHEGSSVHPQRQRQPHAHSVNLDPDNALAVVADLGTDRLMLYDFDSATGRLTPHSPPFVAAAPGAGPRHFAFHPAGGHAFAIHELASTLSVLRYDRRRATLEELAMVSTLPEGYDGASTTAEVAVHPSGRFVYGSNRGHDSIAVFQFDRRRGELSAVEAELTSGRTPRHFAVDPTGRWLLAANQDSDSVVVFRIDQDSGALSPAGHSIVVSRPVCVRFVAN